MSSLSELRYGICLPEASHTANPFVIFVLLLQPALAAAITVEKQQEAAGSSSNSPVFSASAVGMDLLRS